MVNQLGPRNEVAISRLSLLSILLRGELFAFLSLVQLSFSFDFCGSIFSLVQFLFSCFKLKLSNITIRKSKGK